MKESCRTADCLAWDPPSLVWWHCQSPGHGTLISSYNCWNPDGSEKESKIRKRYQSKLLLFWPILLTPAADPYLADLAFNKFLEFMNKIMSCRARFQDVWRSLLLYFSLSLCLNDFTMLISHPLSGENIINSCTETNFTSRREMLCR